MVDVNQLLLDAISKNTDSNKWDGAPFEQIKRISNTKVGAVGQAFIESLVLQFQMEALFPLTREGTRSLQSPWDIEVEGIQFELKTATEDTTGHFQFNHIRYHRPYDALMCLGISPDAIFFNVWTKADVATGKAGNLVSMERQANASYKLTKSPEQLFPISEFETKFREFTNAWTD